jgi:hypothetical protein
LRDRVDQGFVTLIQPLAPFLIDFGARGRHIEIHLHLLQELDPAFRLRGLCRPVLCRQRDSESQRDR